MQKLASNTKVKGMLTVLAFSLAAAPMTAFAEDRCPRSLDSIEEAAGQLGLRAEREGAAVSAHSDEISINVRCEADTLTIETADASGTSLLAELASPSGGSAGGVILADFATGAHVLREFSVDRSGANGQTWTVTAPDGRSAAVSMTFDSAAPDSAAIWVEAGEPERVFGALSDRELYAPAWQSGITLLVAGTGLGEVLAQQGGSEPAKQAVQEALASLTPPLRPLYGKDSDHTNTKKVCAGAFVACVGAFFFAPLAGVCYGGGTACLAAGACEAADCSEDGYN